MVTCTIRDNYMRVKERERERERRKTVSFILPLVLTNYTAAKEQASISNMSILVCIQWANSWPSMYMYTFLIEAGIFLSCVFNRFKRRNQRSDYVYNRKQNELPKKGKKSPTNIYYYILLELIRFLFRFLSLWHWCSTYLFCREWKNFDCHERYRFLCH